MPLKVPIHLTLDFDSTLTTADTLTPLSNLTRSKVSQPLTPSSPSSSTNQPQPQEDPWKPFVDAWTADFKAHQQTYPLAPADRTNLDDELTWQNSLADLERASFERVRDSGLFSGLTFQDVQAGADEAITSATVQFREGWYELIRFVLEWNAQFELDVQQSYLHIISVNFSAAWVWCCMQAAWRLATTSSSSTTQSQTPSHLGTQSRTGSITDLLPITIFANEATPLTFSCDKDGETISHDEAAASTYLHTTTPIHTPSQKLQIYNHLTSTSTATPTTPSGSSPSSSSPLRIYIGDSPTDLQCLLAADLGILIQPQAPDTERSPQRELREICDRVGIPTPSIRGLSESRLGQIVESESSPGGKSLVSAGGLREVREAVRGLV